MEAETESASNGANLGAFRDNCQPLFRVLPRGPLRGKVVPQSLHPRLGVGTPAVELLDSGSQLGPNLSPVIGRSRNVGGRGAGA